ncbi:MAG: site-specific integrase [Mycobacterium sp.]
MTTRRARGDGGLHWDDKRQRWIASVTIGHDPQGRRITRKASGKTKTQAKTKLRELLRDQDDGVPTPVDGYTVADAVAYWLTYGLRGRDEATVSNYTTLAKTHILPTLGRRKLRELSAEDVDQWLTIESRQCSTRTLRLLHSILSRSIRNAQARDKVRRNVVLLCDVPTGRKGRPSKALTLSQATAVINAAAESRLYAYIVLSLLIGARTEELRALRWCYVDLSGSPDAAPPVPPSISVLRSVRAGGDTKTRRSRRALAMPQRCVDALGALWEKRTCGHIERAKCDCLVFTTRVGTPLDTHNVRRDFRKVAEAAGLIAGEWTPRELRHSFVSLLSDDGMPIEHIARLVGHTSTAVTETVYRQQIRPVIVGGAEAMDRIFRQSATASEPIVTQLVTQRPIP